MSLLSGIKSFFGISEVNKDDQLKTKAAQSATDTANIEIGNRLASGQVNNAQSGKQQGQTSQQDLSKGDGFVSNIKKDIDIDGKKLAKQYKENPLSALSDGIVGRKYSAEETTQLQKLLKDKDDLRNYFELAKKGNLSNADIVAGMNEFKENKRSFLGLIKWNKLDEEKYATTMSKFRQYREDFSSKGLANTSRVIIENPELEAPTTHYMVKKNIYSEANVIDAVSYMESNPKKVELFFKNTTDIENIKNDKNATKFNGDTILNIGKKMTEDVELAPVLLETGKKSDMTDKYFTGIADNLVHNKDMKDSYLKFFRLKDSKGKDRFSAKNLYDQTNYMRTKNKKQIQQYEFNTLDLAKYAKLSGDNIVNTSNNMTDHPEIRSQVMEAAANDNISGDEVESTSTYLSRPEEANKPTSDKTASSDGVSFAADIADGSAPTYRGASEPIKASVPQGIYDLQEKERAAFYRSKLSNENDSQYLINITKSNPSLAPSIEKLMNNPNITMTKIRALIDKYGDNPSILEAYIQNPAFFEKLSSHPNITSEQREQLAQFANSGKEDLLFELLSKLGVAGTIVKMKEAISQNKEDDIKGILFSTELSGAEKTKAIQENKSGKFAKERA